MRTLKEIIYNIKNLVKQARPDDVQLSDRQLEFVINYLREKLIVEQLQKGRSISSNIKQDLGQVPLIRVDSGEGSLYVGKPILRTKNKIPQPIELDQRDAITYVGGLDKHSPIAFKTKSYATWNKFNKYSSKYPIAYINNGYMYITNCPNPNLKFINIEGIFSVPREVNKFKNSEGVSCFNIETEAYPISGRMIDAINSLVKEKEFNLFWQIVENQTNNSSDIV